MSTFIMAGGGTGGHVIPALAVARELAARGHEPVFVGTQTGFEARLVPESGFRLELIDIGGLKRVGTARTLKTLGQLPRSFIEALRILTQHRPAAIFSMGGYAAGPVVLAASYRRLPLVVMEPNALPGFTNRRMASLVTRALVSFPETARFFPPGKTEITGVPVRPEFFRIPPKPRGDVLTILITGGSRGSRTLNQAARDAWSHFRSANFKVRLLHQTGVDAFPQIAEDFKTSGLEGEVMPFIADMPAAFAQADLIVCRAGAGAVAELAAAGKPAILSPFPFAADQHQLKNAQAMERAGAAVVVLDREMTGARLFKEVQRLTAEPDLLPKMGESARQLAHPGAARRAADLLEQLAQKTC